MTDLHPNWQATDAGGEPVPVHSAVPAEVPGEPDMPGAPTQSLTRQPAAIAGILLVISFGMAIFYGRSALLGSDTPDTVTIRIAETGFVPQGVSIPQGGTVTWINETDQPQALASNELCTTDRICLSTSPIAPGGTASLGISGDFAPGAYPYYSTASQNLEGILTVLADANAERRLGAQTNLETTLPPDEGTSSSTFSEISSIAPEPDFIALADASSSSANMDPPPAQGGVLLIDPPEDTSGNGEEAGESSSSSSSLSVGPSAGLPTNPNTVGGTRPNTPAAPGTLHSGAPLPISQPETGPGLWFAGLMALGLLFLLSRKSHRIQKLYK